MMLMKNKILLPGEKTKSKALFFRKQRKLYCLVVVLIVISFVAWSVLITKKRTMVRQVLWDISRIEHAVKLFKADNNRCPRDVEELASPPGGDSYIYRTSDPWGNTYKFRCSGAGDYQKISVISNGPYKLYLKNNY